MELNHPEDGLLFGPKLRRISRISVNLEGTNLNNRESYSSGSGIASFIGINPKTPYVNASPPSKPLKKV